MKLWPKWYGHLHRVDDPYDLPTNKRLHIGPCSHGTAYQLVLYIGKYWRYYIVLRKNEH